MSRVKRPVLPWFLLILAIALVPTAILLASQPSYSAEYWGIRATALLGYLFILASVISAAFMQRLVRWFGQPFVTLHHWVAFAGLALITLHPVLLAISGGGLAVFVPDFSSWRNFWIFGGRPAWWLLVVAALAAALRQRFRNGWRIVHGLNYVALLIGAVHATLIGTSFVVSPVARGVLYVTVAAGAAVLAYRRYQEWRRAQARARRARS